MVIYSISIRFGGNSFFSWYITSSSPGQPFPLPGSYWMNIFYNVSFIWFLKMLWSKPSFWELNVVWITRTWLLLIKGKNWLIMTLLVLCKKESLRIYLQVPEAPWCLFCVSSFSMLYFFSHFLFLEFLWSHLRSFAWFYSQRIQIYLTPAFFSLGISLCEMKIFHSKSLQENLFHEHSGFWSSSR